MIVNHDLRFIYVANARAGSTSIESALAEFQQQPDLQEVIRPNYHTRRHIPAIVARDYLGPRVWSTYNTLTIVRNPWDWFVSQHFYNCAKRGDALDPSAPLTPADIKSTYNHLRAYRGVDFVKSATQWAFLCDHHMRPIVKHIGRYEHIADDWTQTCGLLGIPEVPLPHLNSAVRRPYTYYYDIGTAALVGSLYAADATLFGYSAVKETD